MIIHGNKQISGIIYARKASDGGGAVALTNIIRGPQVVFGGLKPTKEWLKFAAKAAILAAFGQRDGMAVIKATNAYLDQLAASDRDKATALAGWLNTYVPEDAKIVYSLVDGIGTRWLAADAHSIIEITDIVVSNFSTWKSKWKWLLTTRDSGVSLGSRLGGAGTSGLIIQCGPKYDMNGVRTYMKPTSDWTNRFLGLSAGQYYNLTCDFANNKMMLDDSEITLQWDRTALAACNPTLQLHNATFVGMELDDHPLVPFIRDNANGLLDCKTNTFYGVTSGSMTISETPSTP